MTEQIQVSPQLREKRKKTLWFLFSGYLFLLISNLALFVANIAAGVQNRVNVAQILANNAPEGQTRDIQFYENFIDGSIAFTSIILFVIMVTTIFLIAFITVWIKKTKNTDMSVYTKGHRESVAFSILTIPVIIALLAPLGAGLVLFENILGAIITFILSLFTLLAIAIGWVLLSKNVGVVKETFRFQETYAVKAVQTQQDKGKTVVKKVVSKTETISKNGEKPSPRPLTKTDNKKDDNPFEK